MKFFIIIFNQLTKVYRKKCQTIKRKKGRILKPEVSKCQIRDIVFNLPKMVQLSNLFVFQILNKTPRKINRDKNQMRLILFRKKKTVLKKLKNKNYRFRKTKN